MKRLVAFFCTFLISAALFVPVFAGSSPQQTDSIGTDSVEDVPVFAVGSGFVYAPGSHSYGSFTANYDYTLGLSSAWVTYPFSNLPQFFEIHNNTSSVRYFVITSDYGVNSFTVNVIGDNIFNFQINNSFVTVNNNTWISYSDFDVLSISIHAGSTACFALSVDPQQNNTLFPIYNLFITSGVNSEWASIGVVILASLLFLSLIIFIFKLCFGKRH